MTDLGLRRLTGFAGLAAAVLMLIELPLYFVYSGPPPEANVLTRGLFGLLGLTCLAVYLVGLRKLLGGWDSDLAAQLAGVAGLVWVVLEFVATSMETGAVIAAHAPTDPTVTVSGTYVLYGTTTRLVEALFLIAFGVAVIRSAALERWTSRCAFGLAAVNLAFVPSLYFGNDPADFYAANGWGTTATTGGLFMLWLLATSVSVLRGARVRLLADPRLREPALAG